MRSSGKKWPIRIKRRKSAVRTFCPSRANQVRWPSFTLSVAVTHRQVTRKTGPIGPRLRFSCSVSNIAIASIMVKFSC